MINRRAALLASLAALAAPAGAAAWPERTVKLVVPYPAGGGVDTAARIYAVALSGLLKQQVIVDNRPGAAGAIGAQAVAKSPADGYTVLMASPAEVMVSPIAGQALPYDPQKDLAPVALGGETPLAIVAYPQAAPKGLQDLIARAKAQDLKLSYGTPGNGSSMHFAGEAFKSATGLNWQHVPYKGAAPAVNDVLGGQIECVISGLPPLMQHIKAGKLTALAVTSSRRVASLPDVPSISEFPGLADSRFTNWMGIFVPQGTPQDVIDHLARAVESASADPGVAQRLQDAGWDPSVLRGSAFVNFLNDERARYTAVAKRTGIKVD